MRLRIHHGAAEVGGNCIELQCSGKTLLLDLGLPLDSAPQLPQIPGLEIPDANFLGVVLSHPHLDHYGLLPRVRPEIPVWIGQGAKRLLEAAVPFTAGAVIPQTLNTYDSDRPFEIGPFRITPYLMDHSAFDAHALLIEGAGRRIFYTGDFRGHGRKAYAFDRFVKKPPRDMDILLMEGTSIGRTEPPMTEAQVEDESSRLMRDCAGLVLACFSGQNIDRFVTVLRASIRAGRVMIIDAYMANLIAGLGLASLPDIRSSPNIRVFLPRGQRRMIIREKRFDLIEPFAAKRIYRDEFTASPGRFTMMFRASMIGDLAQVDLAGGALIYSLWPGYLNRDRTDLRVWAQGRGVAFQVIHSSGHAYADDLKRMAETVAPRMLVPIHSAMPERYVSMFGNVTRIANGEWLELS